MTTALSILRRYAAGDLTAEKAASEFGVGVSVSEVILMLRAADLAPPEPPLDQQRREVLHALEVLGLPPPETLPLGL